MDKSEVVGAFTLGTIGIGAGLLLIKAMADNGTSGAAEITSGLANIGEVLGGGMKTGLVVTSAIPVVTSFIGAEVGELISEKSSEESFSLSDERLEQMELELSKSKAKLQQIVSNYEKMKSK